MGFGIDPIPTITFTGGPVSLDIPNATIVDPTKDVGLTTNTWARLEPLPLTPDFAPALQAAIADPLWLICRQWQFLEFAGDDGGSPIDVRLEGEIAPLTTFAPGVVDAGAAARARPYAAESVPLEVAVEREAILSQHPRLVAEAGQHLLRMLAAGGVAAVRDALIAAFPLKIPPTLDTDADGEDWRQIAQGRSIDARVLAAALTPLQTSTGTLSGLPPGLSVPSTAQAKTIEVLGRWLSWFRAFITEPEKGDSWLPRRLEYAFGAGAMASAGEVVLAAQEYTDGTLDWYSAGTTTQTIGTKAAAPTKVTIPPGLPTPLEYPGKPADRFWEFEDANVSFGNADAGPTDLGRLALIEFALIYGNDWFIVPLTMPVGSLFRVTTFKIRDTFGVETTIGPSRSATNLPWTMFTLDGRAADGSLFLAPTLVDTLESAPLEEVALFRDEMANMVWGVERRVQGIAGDPYDRTAAEYQRAAQQQVDGPPVDAQLIYRLATSVPDHWIPFVPVPAEGSDPGINPVNQLQRRTLVRTELDGTRRIIQPVGTLLRSDPSVPPDTEAPLRIDEEEVPREGAVVTRSFQFGRWFDGASFLWVGKRKRVGRGEGSSGLRFDVAERR